MQPQPDWKSRALAALEQQAQRELQSGYDVKESLMAVSAMKNWLTQNETLDANEFLPQLNRYYAEVKQNWLFPGEYSGGTATLGSCKRLIEEAINQQH